MKVFKVFGSALVLAAAVSWPTLASAQNGPPPSPSPDFRAQMDAMRATAKSQAFAALTPAHRTQVQAIVSQFSSGAIASPRDAAKQIDAVLTPAESQAVDAIAVSTRAAMRSARSGGGGPPDGGGPPGAGGPPGGANAGSGAMNSANGGPPGGSANGGPPGGSANGAPPDGPPSGGQGGARGPDAGRFLLMMSADPAKLRNAMRPPPAQ